MYFSDENVRLILLKNNGYRKCTAYAGNDIQEDRYYTIADGKLFLRHIGKDQGKPYDRIEVCNLEVARDFLIRTHMNQIHRKSKRIKM